MNETTALLTRHKLTVHDYHRMAEAGILAEDDRVELIDGEIIDMAPIGVRHNSMVLRISQALFQACGNWALVSVQNSIRLDDHNEPQPDFAILKPRADFYATQLPGPADIFLLIEVSDTSLRYDLNVKVPLYAKAGIPEVWIVNLRDRVVISHRSPSSSGFTANSPHAAEAVLRLTAAPDIVVPVADLLGEPQLGV